VEVGELESTSTVAALKRSIHAILGAAAAADGAQVALEPAQQHLVYGSRHLDNDWASLAEVGMQVRYTTYRVLGVCTSTAARWRVAGGSTPGAVVATRRGA
jgi:hypothetical protein